LSSSKRLPAFQFFPRWFFDILIPQTRDEQQSNERFALVRHTAEKEPYSQCQRDRLGKPRNRPFSAMSAPRPPNQKPPACKFEDRDFRTSIFVLMDADNEKSHRFAPDHDPRFAEAEMDIGLRLRMLWNADQQTEKSTDSNFIMPTEGGEC